MLTHDRYSKPSSTLKLVGLKLSTCWTVIFSAIKKKIQYYADADIRSAKTSLPTGNIVLYSFGMYTIISLWQEFRKQKKKIFSKWFFLQTFFIFFVIISKNDMSIHAWGLHIHAWVIPILFGVSGLFGLVSLCIENRIVMVVVSTQSNLTLTHPTQWSEGERRRFRLLLKLWLYYC